MARFRTVWLFVVLCRSLVHSQEPDANASRSWLATLPEVNVTTHEGYISRPVSSLNLSADCAQDYEQLTVHLSAGSSLQSEFTSDCTRRTTSEKADFQKVERKQCSISYIISQNGVVIRAQSRLCLPSSCSTDDASRIFHAALPEFRTNISGTVVNCIENRSLDQKAIIAMSILALLGGIMLIGTIADAGRAAYRYITDAILRSEEDIFSAVYSVPTSPIDESTPLITRTSSRLAQPLPQPPSFEEKRGCLADFISAFSAYRNGKHLLSTNIRSTSGLRCINGMRFISLCWLAQQYTFTYMEQYYEKSQTSSRMDDLSKLSFMSLPGSTLAMDSLLLLNGILVMFLVLKELDDNNGILGCSGWTKIYLHRFMRVTPVYGLIIMVWSCLGAYMVDMPSAADSLSSGSLDPPCLQYWWTNLLYINNLYPNNAAPCMAWSWFVATDMQFFVITPLLSYIVYRFLPLGLILIAALTCSSGFAAAAVTVSKEVGIGLTASASSPWRQDTTTSAYFFHFYGTPWCRFQAYGVGLLFAVAVFRGKQRLRLLLPVVIAGWIIAAAVCFVMVLAPITTGGTSFAPTMTESVLYNSLGRAAWTLSLCWIIWACISGYGGWINTLLSWRATVPLSKLTHVAYIVQPTLVITAVLVSGQFVHFGSFIKVLYFVSSVVLAYLISYVSILLTESPLMAVERLVAKRVSVKY